MSLIVVGLNHRTVPVELLERMAVPSGQVGKVLADLCAREHVAEAVVLSTCNRTEIYAKCTRFHAAVQDISEFLAGHSGSHRDDLSEHLYTYFDDAAITHLFTVAAGVDSMIVGESEILGQVRSAWQTAESEGQVGPSLSRAFRHAIGVGKRVRTETEIGRHAVSVSSAAVALAQERLGSLSGKRVLVLGAGDVGEGMTVALASAGVSEVVVANRTRSRATHLAARIEGRAVALDEVVDELVEADLLLTSTGADQIVVERADVVDVMERRGGRELLIVDVAMPRDVDPGVADVPGVTHLDLDDLKAFAAQSHQLRQREVSKVRNIVTQEMDRYRADRLAREIAPIIASLHDQAEDIRTSELVRLGSRLSGLDAHQMRAVEALTQGIVRKMLHEPTMHLKDFAGTARGEVLADAVSELFDLPERPDNSPAATPDPAS